MTRVFINSIEVGSCTNLLKFKVNIFLTNQAQHF